VAPAAIGCPAYIKLLNMNVVVAIYTINRQSGELLAGKRPVVLLEMTITAGFLCMGTLKREVRFLMVEIYRTPPVLSVTAFATIIRVVFLTDESLMDVLMTVNASLADIPETPGSICFDGRFFMAGKTWCRKVCSF
jgi:hypothetical protein